MFCGFWGIRNPASGIVSFQFAQFGVFDIEHVPLHWVLSTCSGIETSRKIIWVLFHSWLFSTLVEKMFVVTVSVFLYNDDWLLVIVRVVSPFGYSYRQEVAISRPLVDFGDGSWAFWNTGHSWRCRCKVGLDKIEARWDPYGCYLESNIEIPKIWDNPGIRE